MLFADDNMLVDETNKAVNTRLKLWRNLHNLKDLNKCYGKIGRSNNTKKRPITYLR